MHSNFVFQRRQALATAFASFTSRRFCRQCQASARYIAPVSTYTKPSFFAMSLALVLLPLALVPSSAMTMGCLVSMLLVPDATDENEHSREREDRDDHDGTND